MKRGGGEEISAVDDNDAWEGAGTFKDDADVVGEATLTPGRVVVDSADQLVSGLALQPLPGVTAGMFVCERASVGRLEALG